MKLRRFPLVHRPLQWVNRAALPALRAAAFGLLRRFSTGRFGPPRGSFSDFDQLQAGQLEGRVVLTEQGAPELPDPSIILLCGRNQHREQPWPVFWTRHDQARLLGASLAHVNGRGEISLEAVYGRARLETDPAWLYAGMRPPLPLAGSWTSIIGQWLRNDRKSPYAHWLLDALPRLALYKEFPPGTGVLVPPQLFPSQVESLKLLGLWERCRKTPERHLRIEHFYFSAPPSMIVCHSPYAVEVLRSTFFPLAGQPPSTPKRFFIRRTSYGRNMINEAEVLAFFERLGWAIVDTAQLGFVEQIHWFSQAEAICAIHGSGTANMVWCAPGCKFIEMFARDYLAGDQEWIAQCVRVEYHFMIFPCDHKLDAAIDITQLEAKLNELKLL